jgi:prolyl 4-hydroxylase
MNPSPLLFLVLLLFILSTSTNAGYLFSSFTSNEVEVEANGDTTSTTGTTKTNKHSCEEPVLPEIPSKLLAPLGFSGNYKSTSLFVVITSKDSTLWCGVDNSLTNKLVQGGGGVRSAYKKMFIANSNLPLVRSAFSITKKSQLPAIGVIEPTTGKRYVLRNNEIGGDDNAGMLNADLSEVLEMFKRPKPLDIFDLSWVQLNGNNNINSFMREENMDLIIVMVKNSKQAKKLVKGGLRRLAQKRRGTVRILLCKDTNMFQRYQINHFPSFTVYNSKKDTIQNHGRIDTIEDISNVLNQLIAPKIYLSSEHVWEKKNYPGKFHRVSWSPNLYVMDNFLSDAECKSMIDNAYPTLSTGSLVGDNINKKIKDLRFTVVPENKITEVEQAVINRIHDHVRISEEHGEILQVSEYLPGQKYTLHPDSIDSSAGPHSMQRVVTFLMYLNDVDEGGATIFPRGNGQNQHMTRQDTEPWNLKYFCNMTDTLKIKPKKGRAVFWYNHHTDLSWDSNTIHGACHVKKGIKYVAQRWIRWHTTQTPGFNPLQRSLDRAQHLTYALREQEKISKSTGADQTKLLLNRVSSYENELNQLKNKLNTLELNELDLNQRISDLGDVIPISIKPSNIASLWRTWYKSKILFLPILNNVNNNIAQTICLYHDNDDGGCNDNIRSIYSSKNSLPTRASNLQATWYDGYMSMFRFAISRSPYSRLVHFYKNLVIHNNIQSKLDKTWKKRLLTIGSFFEFIVGPVRMYHFSMTPTAGGDIGRHPGKITDPIHF